MPNITLFTTPKPFTDPHISLIQRNALKNWLALGDEVKIVVVGDEQGASEVCSELDILQLPDVRRNEKGTPLISSIFQLSRDAYDSPFLVYSNADILFLPNMVEMVNLIARRHTKFLGVGQRWDWNVDEPLRFTSGWESWLDARVHDEGKLHLRAGSDFFIYPRECFQNIPDFTVGRAGWDNWMIYRARWQHYQVVDLSGAFMVIHQNHDYSHLPGGIRHYHQPESAVNVELAGGRHTIFTLEDSTHVIRSGKVIRKRLNWESFWREVEVFPLVSLHSILLWKVTNLIFHPIKTFERFKGWFMAKIMRSRKDDR